MASAADRVEASGRVIIAGIGGVTVGNLLWSPIARALTPAFLVVCLAAATPLILCGVVVSACLPDRLQRHPLRWTTSTALLLTLAYMALDHPTNIFALERLSLYGACLVSACVIYLGLPAAAQRLSRTATPGPPPPTGGRR